MNLDGVERLLLQNPFQMYSKACNQGRQGQSLSSKPQPAARHDAHMTAATVQPIYSAAHHTHQWKGKGTHRIVCILDKVYKDAKRLAGLGEQMPQFLHSRLRVPLEKVKCASKLKSSLVEDLAPGEARSEGSLTIVVHCSPQFLTCDRILLPPKLLTYSQ